MIRSQSSGTKKQSSEKQMPSTWLDRSARRALYGRLADLRGGELYVCDADGREHFGAASDLRARINVLDSRFFRDAVLGGTLSIAESYIQGHWDCDDLTALFRLFIRNLAAADQLDGGFPKLSMAVQRILHWLRANTPGGSRKNIQAHYDLGNEFFRLWLDETWAYSSGIFSSPEVSLHAASVEKFDRACRKLQLDPDDQLLEIGTGWGGLALHAAREYGCRVTTTTISQEQIRVARERVEAAGLAERVTLLQQDYRHLTGRFNKLVSIEMIEAVGHRFFDDYFRKCGELLTPDGTMVLQAIVMPERRYQAYLGAVDFIQKYVFPGGCLPSTAAMLESIGRTTDLRFVHAEDFAPHYAETLRRWRRAFHARLDDVRALGYSEQFIRLWDYYLCYCEALFEERYVGVVQLQFDKPKCRRDPILLSAQAAGRPWRPHLEQPTRVASSHSAWTGN